MNNLAQQIPVEIPILSTKMCRIIESEMKPKATMLMLLMTKKTLSCPESMTNLIFRTEVQLFLQLETKSIAQTSEMLLRTKQSKISMVDSITSSSLPLITSLQYIITGSRTVATIDINIIQACCSQLSLTTIGTYCENFLYCLVRWLII